jgi:hypothetical protein
MKKFEIFETKNYGLFKYLPFNRDVDKKHVDLLCKSINKFGLVVPIIVTNDNYVIDGQHRLEALIQLQKPVFYVINNNVNKDCVVDINTNQQGWKVINHIKSYAVKGNLEYKRLLEIIDDYIDDFTLSGITDAFNSKLKMSSTSLIKKGIYELNEDLGEMVLENCQNLRDVIGKNAISTKFVRALKKIMFKNEHFDIDRLIKNCKSVKKIYIYNNEYDIIQEILDVYNYKLRTNKLEI